MRRDEVERAGDQWLRLGLGQETGMCGGDVDVKSVFSLVQADCVNSVLWLRLDIARYLQGKLLRTRRLGIPLRSSM